MTTPPRKRLTLAGTNERATVLLKVLAIVALAGLILTEGVSFLMQVRYAVIVALGGVFLAYFVYPPVHWLNVRLPLWAALTIVYSIVGIIVAGALWFVVPTVLVDSTALARNLPGLLEKTLVAINSPRDPFIAWLPQTARASVQTYISKVPSELGAYLQRDVASIASGMLAFVLSTFSASLLALAIPVASIYMLAEGPQSKRFVIALLPEASRSKMLEIIGQLDVAVGGFIRGQLIVAGVVGSLVTVMLAVLGVPYALLVGVGAGLADIIPYVGPFVGAFPGVAIALGSNGVQNALWVTLGFVLINQLEAHLIAPRIVGSTVRIPPLIVIFALLIGGELFGIVGLLIAVPIAGVIRVLIDVLARPKPVTLDEVQPGLTEQPLAQVAEEEAEPRLETAR